MIIKIDRCEPIFLLRIRNTWHESVGNRLISLYNIRQDCETLKNVFRNTESENRFEKEIFTKSTDSRNQPFVAR